MFLAENTLKSTELVQIPMDLAEKKGQEELTNHPAYTIYIFKHYCDDPKNWGITPDKDSILIILVPKDTN